MKSFEANFQRITEERAAKCRRRTVRVHVEDVSGLSVWISVMFDNSFIQLLICVTAARRGAASVEVCILVALLAHGDSPHQWAETSNECKAHVVVCEKSMISQSSWASGPLLFVSRHVSRWQQELIVLETPAGRRPSRERGPLYKKCQLNCQLKLFEGKDEENVMSDACSHQIKRWR